jgi:cytochrome c
MEIRPVAVALPWLMLAGALCATAVAQQPSMEDLRRAPMDRQVVSVDYCGGQYTIGFADKSSRKFGERDLPFATDSSALGPPTGRPVVVPTARVGDRALVVFAEPKELATFIHVTC